MATSPAITLEKFRHSDVDVAVEWLMDERIAGSMGWDTCKTREDALFLLNYDILLRPWYRAFYVDGKGPVGIIYTKLFRGIGACRAEVGGFLAPEYWNKGVTTAGLKMAVADLFNKWPQLERIETQVNARNSASLKVVLKAGFKKDGLMESYVLKEGKPVDIAIFSFLRRAAKL